MSLEKIKSIPYGKKIVEIKNVSLAFEVLKHLPEFLLMLKEEKFLQ